MEDIDNLQMNSLAQFKRLAVVGARFQRVFAAGPGGERAAPSIRIVNHVQSNAIAFRADAENASSDQSNRSWLWFPKAKDIRFENGRMILLDLEGRTRMTLQYLGACA